MAGFLFGYLEKGALRRWDAAVRRAEGLDQKGLKRLRRKAFALGQRANRVVEAADARLAEARSHTSGIRRPLHCDWAWRPVLWSAPFPSSGVAAVASKTEIGSEVKVFHDCPLGEISVRQRPNGARQSAAPYGVGVDVFGFEGSFLSLAVDLPDEGVRGLLRRHVVRLDIVLDTERPLEVFGRLNVRHGPNVEKIVRQFDGHDGELAIEFDMAATRLDEDRVEGAWLDLIFEGPEMNQIVLRDLTLTRRPRAEF